MERPEERDDEQCALQVAAAVGGAAFGMGVDLLIGHAGGVVVGAAATQVFQHGLERLSGLRRQQATAMFQVAADAAGWSLDELLEHITADPHRLQLFAAATRAAAETALAAKIRAVGRALATGVMATEDAQVDRQRFIVETLGDLELPHWQTLDLITQRYEGYGAPVDDTGGTKAYGWTIDALRSRVPHLLPILGGVVPVLASRGLIANTSYSGLGYNGPDQDRWIATDYGHDCLAEFERSSQETAS